MYMFFKINIFQSIYDAQYMLSRRKKTLVNTTNKILSWSGKNEKTSEQHTTKQLKSLQLVKTVLEKTAQPLENRIVTEAQQSVRSLE